MPPTGARVDTPSIGTHRPGVASRSARACIDALLDENAVLTRALADAQACCTRQGVEHARRGEHAAAQIMQLRAELLMRQTEIAQLREQIAQWQQQGPQLERRLELDLHARDRRQAHPASATVLPSAARAVLCIGASAASMPGYRQLVEHVGSRFMHRGGGDRDSAARLDASLRAADLVICHAGCISHDAYWRVKDHCKRTGKRCLFVDNPSRSALLRALDDTPAAPAADVHQAFDPAPAAGAAASRRDEIDG